MIFTLFKHVILLDFGRWDDRVSLIPYIEYISDHNDNDCTFLFAFLKWRVYVEIAKEEGGEE